MVFIRFWRVNACTLLMFAKCFGVTHSSSVMNLLLSGRNTCQCFVAPQMIRVNEDEEEEVDNDNDDDEDDDEKKKQLL